ncbi:ABC transporter permease subunit [Pelagibius sp. CAU 1746]|uniref:ABC transporter permease n=1 Tax=Pelagibius sp. CAU 1746 TaxID=3140370 RepID=UPI00325B8FE8
MRAVHVIAGQEIRVGLRNRWIIATTLLLAALALSLTLLGSAPTGTVDAGSLAVVVVSLSSLTIFLLPLIALLLSFDTIVGEQERGSLVLLLAYPVARWEVLLGKFLGQAVILAFATVVGYGSAVAVLLLRDGLGADGWPAFVAMLGSSVLLGAAFLALGSLASVIVRERATAAGIAVAVWLLFVLLYDTALLGLLVADQGRFVGPAVFDALLLLNPADAYRLFNLTGSEDVSVYAGMAGPGESGLSPAVLLAALAAWVMVPLGLAAVVFSRRQI